MFLDLEGRKLCSIVIFLINDVYVRKKRSGIFLFRFGGIFNDTIFKRNSAGFIFHETC